MIVGREKEIELLKGLLEEEDSQFVANIWQTTRRKDFPYKRGFQL